MPYIGETTCRRILRLIVELEEKHIKTEIETVREVLKSEFLCIQLDMWSTKNCKHVFLMVGVSFIFPSTGDLKEYQLSCSSFPRDSHSGMNIKNFLQGVFDYFGILPSDIGSGTLDGASNGLKAMRLLDIRNYRVCLIHDIARAVHFAMTTDNDTMVSVLKSHKRFAALCHRSHVVHDIVFKRQTEVRGVGNELELMQMKGGKWGAQYDCLRRNLLLKPCIKAAVKSILEVNDSDEEADEDMEQV